MTLPLPVLPEYAAGTGRFYSYIWDTTGIPELQDQEGWVVITPQTGKVVIYGQQLLADDREEAERLRSNDRILGWWYSPLCPEGEPGTVPANVCQRLSMKQFSDAYQRDWEPKGENDGKTW